MSHDCPYCKCDRDVWRTLSSVQVRALVKFRQAVRHYGRNRIHLKREMFDTNLPFKLTLSEHNNFAGMRPFGLVHHGDPENPKSGEWLLTTNGAAWLRGEKLVLRRRRVGADGHVVEKDSKSAVHITEYKKGIPGFDQFYETIRTEEPLPANLFESYPESKPPATQTLPIFR
jgi:hypothetical protein